MRQKLASALILILILTTLCGLSACAESAPADGLYTIGVTSSTKMFKVVDCALRVEDGKMNAVLTLSGVGYGYVYAGTSAEAEAAPQEAWAPYVPNWDGKYTYEIEIPALDAEIAVCGFSIKYQKWYDRTLVFNSATLSPRTNVAPDGVYDGALHASGAIDGLDCVLTARDGAMRVELAGDVQALRIGGEEYAAEDGKLSFPLESLDLRTAVEVQQGDAWSEDWLRIDSAELSDHSVTAPDGVYSIEVKTDSNLLKISGCVLSIRNGVMTAMLTAANGNYDYLYLGLAKDAPDDEAAWIAGAPDASGANTYIIEIPSLDNEISVATHSAKKSMWYDRTITLDSATLQSLS